MTQYSSDFTKYRYMLCLILLLPITVVLAQTLPTERTVDWSLAGLQDFNPTADGSYNFLNYGGVGDGLTPNDDALTNLLNSASGDFIEIYFPQGVYLFNQSIDLPAATTLYGESSELVQLKFDLGGAGHLINIEGHSTNVSTLLSDNVLFGANQMAVEDASPFQAGDYIELIANDTALITSNWAFESTGQINKIVSVNNNTIVVASPFRRAFDLTNQPRITKLELVENVGINNLSIERLDSTQNQTSNIYLAYAANCQIKCIESRYCNFAHVDVRHSTNIEVSGSYFYNAFKHGGGGQGYGVMLHFATGESLVYNSIFETLRHSMILQAGANGNVFAYNYSIDPFWTGVSLPSYSAGDLVLHGNYPYANLFEGNIGQNIVIDDSHGINGPLNTFFRNRAELYGVFMNFNPPSDNQNFIGNEISSLDSLGFYFLSGEDHFEYGNNHTTTIVPMGTDDLPESSLFLNAIPAFYQSIESWPPIGIPNLLDSKTIEAKHRYLDNQYTACATTFTATQQIVNPTSLLLFPNPVTDQLQLDFAKASAVSQVKIVALSGQEVLVAEFKSTLDLSNLNAGIYFIQLQLKDGSLVVERFVVGQSLK